MFIVISGQTCLVGLRYQIYSKRDLLQAKPLSVSKPNSCLLSIQFRIFNHFLTLYPYKSQRGELSLSHLTEVITLILGVIEMKSICSKLIMSLALFFILGISNSYATEAVTIATPTNGATVSSPVKVCLQAWGVEVEPAKKGVNPNKGHNHILIDVDLPENLGNPIGKDANHVHMGDGSKCKSLKLAAGKHTITTLFAQGNHVPFNPPLSDTVEITVK